MTNLKELFSDKWGDDQPANLVDLVEAPYENLDATSKKLREMAVKLVHLFERSPVVNARAAYDLVSKHHLPIRSGRWSNIVLTRERERLYVRTPGNSMRMLHSVTKVVPSVETLTRTLNLPDNGSYLFLYGGGLDVLSPENFNRFDEIRKNFSVSDIVVWETSPESATFWSVRAGCGQNGNTQFSFPEHLNLDNWRQLCNA